jgi:phosphosulfolactate phosphohydrolase-like enzyme
VVIDVLRAATTMIHALAAGAVEILPCQRVDAARRLVAGFAPGSALLGGERLGLPIPGFDLGNSPSEYTRERVAGRSVVFTSTNGTRALARCRRAERAFLAAFVNLSAVARAVSGAERLHLLCAGTRARLSEEDLLLAGALADCLETRALDAKARGALTRWRELGVDRLNRAPSPNPLSWPRFGKAAAAETSWPTDSSRTSGRRRASTGSTSCHISTRGAFGFDRWKRSSSDQTSQRAEARLQPVARNSF